MVRDLAIIGVHVKQMYDQVKTQVERAIQLKKNVQESAQADLAVIRDLV